MAQRGSWTLEVRKSERISPNMQRITFAGEGLRGFPEESATAYLKIRFPAIGGGLKRGINRVLGRESIAVRSYTVRCYDPATGELEIDFVLHADAGAACTWAKQAKPGDVLHAGGPGPKKLLNLDSDWFVIVGDLSALPAIGANLARLPHAATGYALIEIPDEADRQDLTVPPGVDVQWVINPHSSDSAQIMAERVRALVWKSGRCDAWVAGELNTVRAVREHLRNERGMTRDQMYASSYWQLGLTDEEHRVEKAADQEAAAATA